MNKSSGLIYTSNCHIWFLYASNCHNPTWTVSRLTSLISGFVGCSDRPVCFANLLIFDAASSGTWKYEVNVNNRLDRRSIYY